MEEILGLGLRETHPSRGANGAEGPGSSYRVEPAPRQRPFVLVTGNGVFQCTIIVRRSANCWFSTPSLVMGKMTAAITCAPELTLSASCDSEAGLECRTGALPPGAMGACQPRPARCLAGRGGRPLI